MRQERKDGVRQKIEGERGYGRLEKEARKWRDGEEHVQEERTMQGEMGQR